MEVIDISKIIDLTNQKFGKLTVIKKTENPNSKKKRTYWLCICDCGESSIVDTSSLKSGKTNQCWKCAHNATGKARRVDLTGKKYGHLTVTKMIYNYNGTKRTKCLCDCDCGTKNHLTSPDSLRRATSNTSCGCQKRNYIIKSCGRDINGQKFGRLTVLETIWNEEFPKVKCQCDCGNIVILNKNYVQSGHTQSCGCLQKEMASLTNTKDWTGIVSDYGVEFISQSRKNKLGQWLWNCKCPLCNKIFEILPANIMDGSTTSCGCKIQSKGERYIQYILENNNIKYIPQYSFDDCKYKYKLKFDFALLDDKGEVFYLIEYDGKQHFEPIEFYGGEKHFEETKIRDSIKNQYCFENKIKLLRLKYDLSNEEIKEKIVNIIYP